MTGEMAEAETKLEINLSRRLSGEDPLPFHRRVATATRIDIDLPGKDTGPIACSLCPVSVNWTRIPHEPTPPGRLSRRDPGL